MTAPGELPNTVMGALSDGSCLTLTELKDDIGLTGRQISDAVGKLILRGWAERVEIGCYQLTKAGKEAQSRGETITSGPRGPHTGKTRPRRNTFRQRAWNAMRMSATFTLADLVIAAAGSDDTDAEANVQWFVRRLVIASYVIELPVRARGAAMTSNGFKRYRLIRNTGEIAPIWSVKHRRMIDHNMVRS